MKVLRTPDQAFSAIADFPFAPHYAEVRDAATGIYKRLVLKNDRIIGAVLYGDTGDGPWFFDLVRAQTDTRDMRDTLIFGESYQGGVPLNPYGGRCSLVA